MSAGPTSRRSCCRCSSGQATCAEIMSREVVAIGSEAPLREVLDLLRRHHIEALPVTDERARVLGIVTQTDLVVELLADAAGRPVPRPRGMPGRDPGLIRWAHGWKRRQPCECPCSSPQAGGTEHNATVSRFRP